MYMYIVFQQRSIDNTSDCATQMLGFSRPYQRVKY